jgi:V/A-type H+-transporting ATPase subunit I
MLTDFFYGALLASVSFMLYKRYRGVSKGMTDLAVIFMACGVASIFFGVLTGSYLGDFVGKYLLGKTSQEIAVWMDPLSGSNSIRMLVFICVGGFLHVFFGYLVGAIDSLKRGQWRQAVTEYFSWYIFAGGLFIAGLSSIPEANPFLPSSLYPLGIVLAFTGLVLLYMGLGLMMFIEIIGVVGNSLSYARILAMALTTAGIGFAFNFLADMALKTPVAGVFLAAFIFIVGHLINILMNTLGAFVHSLRLQYVEFFGTFYDGGGREFKPFQYEKVYT